MRKRKSIGICSTREVPSNCSAVVAPMLIVVVCNFNLSTELMLFFRRLQSFGYLQYRMTVAELMNKSDHDLFL